MEKLQHKRVNSSSVNADNIALASGEFLIDIPNGVLHIGTDNGTTTHLKFTTTSNLTTLFNGYYGGTLSVNSSTNKLELKSKSGSTTLSSIGFTLDNNSGKIRLKDTSTGTVYAELEVGFAKQCTWANDATLRIGGRLLSELFDYTTISGTSYPNAIKKATQLAVDEGDGTSGSYSTTHTLNKSGFYAIRLTWVASGKVCWWSGVVDVTSANNNSITAATLSGTTHGIMTCELQVSSNQTISVSTISQSEYFSTQLTRALFLG